MVRLFEEFFYHLWGSEAFFNEQGPLLLYIWSSATQRKYLVEIDVGDHRFARPSTIVVFSGLQEEETHHLVSVLILLAE